MANAFCLQPDQTLSQCQTLLQHSAPECFAQQACSLQTPVDAGTALFLSATTPSAFFLFSDYLMKTTCLRLLLQVCKMVRLCVCILDYNPHSLVRKKSFLTLLTKESRFSVFSICNVFHLEFSLQCRFCFQIPIYRNLII